MDQHLSNGSRVCIVGGGPAGSFAALHLLDQAAKHGLHLEVLIFEPRDFTRPGPSGCNRCAGILSSRLLEGLQSLGLSIPPELIQADVQSYAVHLQGETVRVERPSPQHRILSVYRGAGPRLLQGAPQASFDAYLLNQACTRGAEVIAARVKQVTWEDRPVVYTADQRFDADFLVLAIGVNSRSPLSDDFGYESPATETMAQNEVLRPLSWPDNQVNVFFTEQPGVMFGALIPKGGYLNVSLLGQNLHLDTVQDFIDARGLSPAREVSLAEQPTANMAANVFAAAAAHSAANMSGKRAAAASPVALCGCTPRIAVRAAHHFYGPRWVAVGDASVVRLYKDGIGSAFYTAQRAMTTAVEQGISQGAFAAGYAPYCRSLALDNRFGQVLFRMWAITLRTPTLLHAWIFAIRRESELPPERRVHQRVLWGMFTGEEAYHKLFWLAISPRATAEVLRGWGKLK